MAAAGPGGDAAPREARARPAPPRLRRRLGPEELTCLPPPPPLLCEGAAEVLAKVAAPKPPPPPPLLPPVPPAAPEPAPPPPAPPRPEQWWQRISPCGLFFHMDDDVVLQTLQVGFRPRGIVAGSGGPRGRSDTGMATAGPGRPMAGPPRPATGRAAGARAPSCPLRDQAAAAVPGGRKRIPLLRLHQPRAAERREAGPGRGLAWEQRRAAAPRRFRRWAGPAPLPARPAGSAPPRGALPFRVLFAAFGP